MARLSILKKPASTQCAKVALTLEAQGLDVSLRPLAGLVEDEKPGVCGGKARGGGRLELEHGRTSAISPSLVPHLQSDAADDIRRDEGER